MARVRWVLMIVAVMQLSGCVSASLAATGREREAFLVRNGLFASTAYRCWATVPTEPVCVRVNQER
jgi:hypothetical protein